MKVTIAVKKGVFKKFNFKTFEVDPSTFKAGKDGKLVVTVRGLNPEFPNALTDFTQDEVLFG